MRLLPATAALSAVRLIPLVALFALPLACDVVEVEEGQQSTLCYNYFRDCVNPIFHNSIKLQNTCANSACHGGGSAGLFRVEPLGNITSFNSAVAMAKANERLLTFPLDPVHSGGIYIEFADTANACYREIESWMKLSVFEAPLDQRPDDPCAAAPVCIVSDVTTDC